MKAFIGAFMHYTMGSLERLMRFMHYTMGSLERLMRRFSPWVYWLIDAQEEFERQRRRRH